MLAHALTRHPPRKRMTRADDRDEPADEVAEVGSSGSTRRAG